MSVNNASVAASTAKTASEDERLAQTGHVKQWLQRPEVGAVFGLLVVILFFAFYASGSMFTLAGIMNFMEPAAQLGILAIAAALLMIGGEFDLSIGSMIAFAGVALGIPLVMWGWPLWACIVFAFGVAAVVGSLNGLIVLRSGLPSFIVTLAFLFILRGLTLVMLKAETGTTQLRGIKDAGADSWLMQVFSGDAFEGVFAWLASQGWVDTFANGVPKVKGIPVEILWFIALALVANWVLTKTRFGNWIFAVGGDAVAARNVGVPVTRVKIILFIFTAMAATLVAMITVLEFGTADASRGLLKEFHAIIAAVIGGCLLTGGYGSAIGAMIGAIIFGMVQIGITYTSINQDWFQVFMGVILLIAVVLNNWVRKKALSSR
ncbi:MAG: ATPase [Gammaproteobacteria bacterium]|nr:MAG: ATPase [Gammaproteobacteria bacterium]